MRRCGRSGRELVRYLFEREAVIFRIGCGRLDDHVISGLPTNRNLGVLNSVSAAAPACHQHTSYVLLSMHSVIENLSGAS